MTWVSRNAPTYSVPCSSWSSTATTVADDSDGDGVAGDDDVVPDVKRVLTGFLKRAIVRCGGGVARYAPRAQDRRRREPMSDDDDFVDDEREPRAQRQAFVGKASMPWGLGPALYTVTRVGRGRRHPQAVRAHTPASAA